MPANILYLGDTGLNTAAAYLAGLMTDWGWHFDYVPSGRSLDSMIAARPYDLYILSDFPAAHLREDRQRVICSRVEQGAGLVMLGGWESFTGSEGFWRGTPVAHALPVEMSEDDDRVNVDTPALVVRSGPDHPILADLPWDTHPPLVGGYNRFTVRDGATELLRVQRFDAARDGDAYTFTPAGSDPMLAVGSHGKGRTAALATDVAPHWVGPMVDWGAPRVTAEADGAFAIEVGCHYARFFRQLLAWAKQSD